jgi:hypothetical protein
MQLNTGIRMVTQFLEGCTSPSARGIYRYFSNSHLQVLPPLALKGQHSRPALSKPINEHARFNVTLPNMLFFPRQPQSTKRCSHSVLIPPPYPISVSTQRMHHLLVALRLALNKASKKQCHK